MMRFSQGTQRQVALDRTPYCLPLTPCARAHRCCALANNTTPPPHLEVDARVGPRRRPVRAAAHDAKRQPLAGARREPRERRRLGARLGLHYQVADARPKVDDVVHARLAVAAAAAAAAAAVAEQRHLLEDRERLDAGEGPLDRRRRPGATRVQQAPLAVDLGAVRGVGDAAVRLERADREVELVERLSVEAVAAAAARGAQRLEHGKLRLLRARGGGGA